MNGSDKYSMLHLYPQQDNHANAAVIGNRKGLEHLKEMIEGVLESKEEPDHLGMITRSGSAVPADGEGHSLEVHMLPGDHENWQNLLVPYVRYLDDFNPHRDPEMNILPPSWGIGLHRRLDEIWHPLDIPEELHERIVGYFELDDEGKKKVKRDLKKWEKEQAG